MPFHFAHRCFIALEMRLRAAALIVRRFLVGARAAVFELGGRPRRGSDEKSPSSAAMAWLIRLNSALSSHSVDRFVEWLLVGACNSVPVMKMPSDQNDGWLNSRRRSFAIFTPVLAPLCIACGEEQYEQQPLRVVKKSRFGDR